MTNTSTGWKIDRTTSPTGEGYGEHDVFVPASDGQTAFVLSGIADLTFEPILFVNGNQQEQTADYTIVGTALTWLDNDFTLLTTDIIDVYYST